MTDPNRAPGYAFLDVRLVHASYELGPDPIGDDEGETEFRYEDKVQVQGRMIVVHQELWARIIGMPKKEPVYLQASVAVEGRFEGALDANVEPDDFANNHAPAIIFAFTREWMHRLTSSAGKWPAVLIPPMNVLELRKQQAPVRK